MINQPEYRSRKFIAFVICISLITVFFILSLILDISTDDIVGLSSVILGLFAAYVGGNSVEHWRNGNNNGNKDLGVD